MKNERVILGILLLCAPIVHLLLKFFYPGTIDKVLVLLCLWLGVRMLVFEKGK